MPGFQRYVLEEGVVGRVRFENRVRFIRQSRYDRTQVGLGSHVTFIVLELCFDNDLVADFSLVHWLQIEVSTQRPPRSHSPLNPPELTPHMHSLALILDMTEKIKCLFHDPKKKLWGRTIARRPGCRMSFYPPLSHLKPRVRDSSASFSSWRVQKYARFPP